MPVLIDAMIKLAKCAEPDLRFHKIYIPPRGGERAEAEAKDTFPLISESLKRLKTPEFPGTGKDIRTLLLLGDSGMGKTRVCLKLAELFWKRWTRQLSQGTVSDDHRTMALSSERIPLYIHLAEYKAYLRAGLLEQLLSELGLTPEESLAIKAMPLLLMLDGFDEVDITYQLYRAQGWDRLGQHIKVIVCSRPEALAHKNTAALFQTSANPQQIDYEIIYLQAFNDKQIGDYLRHYIDAQLSEDRTSAETCAASMPVKLKDDFDAASLGAGIFKDVQSMDHTVINHAFVNAKINEYLIWFERLPSLKALVKTPFLLTVVVQSLPSIIQDLGQDATLQLQQTDVSSLAKAEVKQLTLNRLFDIFLEQWFQEQARRVTAQGWFDGSLTAADVAPYMQAYAQNLAASLLGVDGQLDERGLSEVECLKPELIEPIYDKQLLARYHDKDPKLRQSLLFFKELLPRQMHLHPHALSVLQSMNYDNEYDQPLVLASAEGERELLYYRRDSERRIFQPVKHVTIYEKHLRAIHSGCLLRVFGERGHERFKFLHKSITEYLAARELMQGVFGTYAHYLEPLLDEEQRAFSLNRRLLTKEPAILARLAEAVATESKAQESVAPLPPLLPLEAYLASGEIRQFTERPMPGCNVSRKLR